MLLFPLFTFLVAEANSNPLAMFIKRNDDEGASPTGREDSTELQKMLTSCMINRQILVRGVHARCIALFELVSRSRDQLAPLPRAHELTNKLANQSGISICACAVLRGWGTHRHPYQHPAQVLRAVCDPRRPRYAQHAACGQHACNTGLTPNLFCFFTLCAAGSFVDYSVPYTNDCRLIHNAMQLALQQERQRDAAAAGTKTLSFGDDAKE